jgi:hypothetical protein
VDTHQFFGKFGDSLFSSLGSPHFAGRTHECLNQIPAGIDANEWSVCRHGRSRRQLNGTRSNNVSILQRTNY